MHKPKFLRRKLVWIINYYANHLNYKTPPYRTTYLQALFLANVHFSYISTPYRRLVQYRMKIILQNKAFYDIYYIAFNGPWMDGPKRHSTVFKVCLLMPMDFLKRNQVDKHSFSPLTKFHAHSLTFRAAHVWWRTGKQPNSQIYQTAKACPQ